MHCVEVKVNQEFCIQCDKVTPFYFELVCIYCGCDSPFGSYYDDNISDEELQEYIDSGEVLGDERNKERDRLLWAELDRMIID